MTTGGYVRSPRHDEPWIESHLDLRDRTGDALPGYGWIFPVGDGTVNVGVGLLSTFKGWKSVNTSHLMDAFVAMAPPTWDIRPETALGPPTGGRLPMGGSVQPAAGPTWLVAGDASGAINPFNGEGIAYAYETGRMAAEALDEALRTGDGLALARYPGDIASRPLDGLPPDPRHAHPGHGLRRGVLSRVHLPGPEAAHGGQAGAVRVRHRARVRAGPALPGEVLPGGHGLHHLRHR